MFTLVPTVNTVAPRELCGPHCKQTKHIYLRWRWKGDGRANILRETGAFFLSFRIPTMLHTRTLKVPALAKEEGMVIKRVNKSSLEFFLSGMGGVEDTGPRALAWCELVSCRRTGLFH